MTNSYRQLRSGSAGALVCFPWAGAGSLPFRSWRPHLPDGLALWVARTAGKEDRLREPAPADWPELVRDLTDDLPTGTPLVFFGHCLGAVMAFEVALELHRRKLAPPRRLIAVGMPPTLFPTQDFSLELHEAVRESGTVPEEVLNDPDLFSMIAPAIRADLDLAARYRRQEGRRVDIPVDVLLPSSASSEDLGTARAWAVDTTQSVDVHTIDGDHLMPHGAWPALATAVTGTATGALAAAQPAAG